MPNFNEPEERKNAVDVDYNPLDEPVNEKPYTRANINTDGLDMNRPIDEPTFTPPPINKKANIPQDAKPPKPEPVNPDLKRAPKKEVNRASEHLVDLILNSATQVVKWSNRFLKISDKKLMRLQAEGEINLSTLIDYDFGKKMPIGQFVKEYNEQVSNTLAISEEFKEQVRPLLIEIFAERGMGLSKEQMVIALCAQEGAALVIAATQQKQAQIQMIEFLKQQSQAQSQKAPPPPPPPPPPAPENREPDSVTEVEEEKPVIIEGKKRKRRV